MKSQVNWALTTCLLTVVAFCGNLKAQVAASRPTASEVPMAATTVSSTQTEIPSSRNTNTADSYIIGDDDVLSINVWREPDLSKQIPVRSDGKISLPLMGEVQAAGRTPLQLEQEITAKLRSYITDPQVTVIVQQINSQKFNILGQVTKPGSYPITAGITIVDAIATAGGFRDFAKKKSVYVLRQTPGGEELRIGFNYEEFIKGKKVDKNITLKPHDTIVVP
jgi:polysaccharide export outer membrane protein